MKKMKSRLTCLFLVIFILAQVLPIGGVYVSNAAALDTNLLVNPGGESGNSTSSGWVASEGTNVNTNKLFATSGGRTGNYLQAFAQGMVDGYVNNYQDVDISSQAAAIDSGTLMINFSGYYMKANVKAGDYAKVQIEQLDASGNILFNEERSCTSTGSLSPINWEQFMISEAVQVGVRKIRVSLVTSLAYPGGIGVYSYTGYDDMSLILSESGDKAPLVTQITDQMMDTGSQIGPLSFTATDADSAVNSLTCSASSSNQSLISNANIEVTFTNGDGTIQVTSTNGQTGVADITVAVSDGTKTTNMKFKVTVFPNYQLGMNMVMNGDGVTTGGWTDIQSRMLADGAFNVATLPGGDSKYFMYQDIDITKFASIVDTGMLDFTSSCTTSQGGEYQVEGYDASGNLMWNTNNGTIGIGTRKLRVTVGGVLGAKVDNVNVTLSNAVKVSNIEDMSLAADAVVGGYPFNIVYGGSSVSLTGVSSNTSIVADSTISFGGSGYSRTIGFKTQPGVSGTTDISVKVNGTTYETFRVSVYTVPGIPTITSVQEVTNGVTVSFNPPASDGGKSITKYTVSSMDGEVSVNGSASPITVTGLTACKTYTFTVRAENVAGTGAASDPSSAIQYTTSPSVTTSNYSDITSNTGKVSADVTSDGGRVILERGIEYKKVSDSSYMKVKSDTNVTGSYTIDLASLSKNTQYEVRAYATNSKGTGYGEVITFTTAANMPPVVSEISNPDTIDEDTATAVIPFTISDDTTTAENLTITVTSTNTTLVPNSVGNLQLSGTGTNRSLQVIPAENQYGTADITVEVIDEEGATASKTFTLTVNPVNDAPTANSASIDVSEDTQYSGTLTGNDIDHDSLVFELLDVPTKGSVLLNANGTYTYIPAANAVGPDSFTFKVNDGTVDSNTATVWITVEGVNDAPTADDTFATFNEDTVGEGILTGSDIEGSSITYTKVSDPGNGSVVVETDGRFIYTPNANFSGLDSFTYRVNDGSLDSNIATVTITVTEVNDAPKAEDSVLHVTEDVQKIGTFTASDLEGDGITYHIVSAPQKGSLKIDADGSYTYTPDRNATGDDSFTYKVKDGSLYSNIATVTIQIAEVNDAPVADDSSIVLDEDTLGTGSLNGSDVEGSPLTFTKVSDPNHGTIVVKADGTVTYTPDENYTGNDSFTFTVNDGSIVSLPATVTITVKSINDIPLVDDGSLTVMEDGQQTGSIHATDVEGDILSFAVVTEPVKGTVKIGTDGSFLYTPNSNATGNDSFTFKANDGKADSHNGTIHISISEVNDAPQVTDMKKNTVGNQPVKFTTNDFISHFSDVEKDSLSQIQIVSIGNPINGKWNFMSNGTLTGLSEGQEIKVADLDKIQFVPTENADITATLTWKGYDGTDYSAAADIIVTITKEEMPTGGSVNGGSPSDSPYYNTQNPKDNGTSEPTNSKQKLNIEIGNQDIVNEEGHFIIPTDTIVNHMKATNTAQVEVTVQASVDSKVTDLLLKAEVLEEAKVEEKTVSVTWKDTEDKERYTWAFDKSDLASSKERIEDVNLSIRVSPAKDANNLSDMKVGNGLLLEFAHEGELPCQASVRIYVGDQQGIMPGSKIYLYHNNKETGKLDTLPYSSNYYVDNEGYVTVRIVHCSDYVALLSKAPAKLVTTLKNQITWKMPKSSMKVGNTGNIVVNLPETLQLVNHIKDRTSGNAIGAVTVSYSSGNRRIVTIDRNGMIAGVTSGKAVITTKITLYTGEVIIKKIKITVK